MMAHRSIMNYKMNDVVLEYAKFANVSIREALDIFYTSRLYLEIREGISDMHCRSDGYLAEELAMEISGKKLP